jgi:hypothetical protein
VTLILFQVGDKVRLGAGHPFAGSLARVAVGVSNGRWLVELVRSDALNGHRVYARTIELEKAQYL